LVLENESLTLLTSFFMEHHTELQPHFRTFTDLLVFFTDYTAGLYQAENSTLLLTDFIRNSSSNLAICLDMMSVLQTMKSEVQHLLDRNCLCWLLNMSSILDILLLCWFECELIIAPVQFKLNKFCLIQLKPNLASVVCIGFSCVFGFVCVCVFLI